MRPDRRREIAQAIRAASSIMLAQMLLLMTIVVTVAATKTGSGWLWAAMLTLSLAYESISYPWAQVRR